MDQFFFLNFHILKHFFMSNFLMCRVPSAQKELMMKKILYALAFWNSVNLQLRHIQSPKIRLRIAGIVIARVIFLPCYDKRILFKFRVS